MSADAQPPLGHSLPGTPGIGGAAPSVGGSLPPLAPLPPPAKPSHPKPSPIAKPAASTKSKSAARPAPLIAQPVSDEPAAKLTASVAAGADLFRGPRKFVVSGLVSAIVHCLLVIMLALMSMARPETHRVYLESTGELAPPAPPETLNISPSAVVKTTGVLAGGESPQSLALASIQAPTIGKRSDDRPTLNSPTLTSPGNLGAGDLLTPVGGSPFGMFDGRDGELKRALLQDGGSDASEIAVARGLRWLAAHQREDGSWHFNHLQDGICKYCRNPGNHGSTTASTGLALLPFLGAGQTHMRGEYQETVRKGLEFLKKRMIATPLGGDLQDGVNLYSQAIASLALCEAYAMTRDPDLAPTCREAIRFIVNAQDKNGGGWRYFPGQVGDTTVTGWMLMALKSGQLTYMPVSPEVWIGAKRYLDFVQDDGGAAYGYQAPNKQDATMTAIGLLCRMYAGWPRSQAALARGVRMLSKRGPSEHDLYYDYYATQVLRHYGGPEWTDWNLKMREFLISTQGKEGHASGSWYFPDKHGDQGGRVYNTAMAILILEVYYRHLPIFGQRVLGEGY